ncbi:MAG: fasciclin domain-containing protein [Planctomycetaceae bacterium]|nr:fasciclin domain-containing protein [Planctomycetaceae bacterium]
MKTCFQTLLATLALTALAVPIQAAEKDIVSTAVEAGSFKTLAAALEAAGLVSTLQGPGPFTVFAPTDDAFAMLPAGTVEELVKPENKAQLIAVLTYHVVPGKVAAADVVKLKAAKTVNGQRVEISTQDGNVRVDQAEVVTADIACSNGIIHVIDQVILPTSDKIPDVALKAGVFSTLLAAAKAAGLVEALSAEGPLTVFAPTDSAFAALPPGTIDNLLKAENKSQLAAILKFHVVSGRLYAADLSGGHAYQTLQGASISLKIEGGQPKIGQATVLTPDIDAANGVIHVIDEVLLPPSDDVRKPVSQNVRQPHVSACRRAQRVAIDRDREDCDD